DILTHAGKVKAEVAKKIAEERYVEFDNKRKRAEALAADEEDIKQLEEIARAIEKGKLKSEND
ncbi:MAG: hydroxyacid dehydrogenase, partial [Desulfocapsa sp.]